MNGVTYLVDFGRDSFFPNFCSENVETFIYDIEEVVRIGTIKQNAACIFEGSYLCVIALVRVLFFEVRLLFYWYVRVHT